ncbi:MAG: FAD-dependent oxidoreductase [Candidatus Limiplasma sp.]|nr:FAD-dependent oxidoreductase [Candidatus Limiplasma sp.]
MKPYDVLVAGGGIAGSMAAIAAARAGADVLLVEEEGYLGGSLTACGTGPMMTFHAGEKQVVLGQMEELVSRLKQKNLSVGHVADTTGYTYTVTPFDSEGMKRELELMALEAGVQLLYHAGIVAVKREGEALTGVTVSSCGSHMDLSARCFIDATGDADLLPMAQAPYDQGRALDGKDQPMTLNVRLDHVNVDKVRQLVRQNPALFPLLVGGKEELPDKAARLSISGFREIMAKGRADGEITFDRDIVLCFETNNKDEVIANMTRVNGENPVDGWSLTRAEVEGRRQTWELLGFLRRHVPGFENVELKFTGPRIGIRSSRRLKGSYCLTAQDVTSAVKFADGIAANGYPIDVHSPDGARTDSTHLAYGQYYTIPYRCLYHEGTANLLVAGRNISTTFEAQASTRVSPCSGVLGQAAGVAAAMAAKEGGDVRRVDVQALREALRQANQCVD